MQIKLIQIENKFFLQDVLKVYKSAFANSNFSTLNKKDFEDFLNMGSKIYVLQVKKKIIAYLILLLNKNLGEILSIGVLKNYQNNNYGKYLIKGVFKSNLNLMKINLEVAATNYKAINFYQSLGFDIAGFRKQYYLIKKSIGKGERVDALILEMSL